jgi:uncharacterized membrane protein affecting hemolysin expression
MEIYHKYRRFLNLRRFLLGCLAWWLVTGVIYAVLHDRMTSLEKSKTETGIELTAQYAERVGLPLLERNVASIQALLDEATHHETVIFVAVLDHEKRLIATAGAQRLLAAAESQSPPTDQVNYSESKLVDNEKIAMFQKPVTYGGVKIGQILLITANGVSEGAAYRFLLTALLGFFLMVFIVGYINFRSAGANSLRPRTESRQLQQSPASNVSSTPCISCPLCGAKNPISEDLFNSKRYNLQMDSINLHDCSESVDTKIAERIACSPASQNQNQYWIKRRVILRCAEIIQKLTI